MPTIHHHVDINRYIQTTEGTHSIFIWILIGLIAGYITGRIMRGAGFGPIVDIIVGIVGAIVGGQVTRFVSAEIGNSSMVNHMLQIFRPGVFFNPLDFSKREGVYRFDLTSHNLPMFRLLFRRCLGVDV